MLPGDFYTRRNLQKVFFGGKISHFPNRKNGAFPVTSYPYTLQNGETLLTLGEKLFGVNTDMWLLLADANMARHPDEWGAGDAINIPNTLVTDNPLFNEVLSYKPPSLFIPRNPVFPIISNPVCAAVSGLILNVSQVGILTASWTPVSGAAYYLYQYKRSTDSSYSNLAVTTVPMVSIGGLDPATVYQFQVQVQCSLGGQSGFVSNSATTSSYPACAVLSALTVVSATDTTLSGTFVDGSPGAPGVSYSLEYQAQGASSWFVVPQATTAWTITSLSPGVVYNIRVRRQCAYQGSTYFSNYTGTLTGTTVAACGNATAFAVTNMSNTSISFAWTGNAGQATGGYRVLLTDLFGNTLQTHVVGVGVFADTFTGLTAATQYNIKIQSLCAASTSPGYTNLVITNALACPLPMFIATYEDVGLPGPPRHQVHVRIQGSPLALSYNYYIGGVLVLNSAFTDVTLLVEDDTWVLTQAVVGIQCVCGATNVSGIVTQAVPYTQPNPGAIVCSMPGGDIFNVDPTDFSVAFTMPAGAYGLRVGIRITGTPDFTTTDYIPVPTSPIEVTSLTASTEYDYELITICQDPETMDISYSPPLILTATTASAPPAACPLPPFLNITPVGNTTATAAWSAPTSPLGIAGYKLLLVDTDTSTTVSELSFDNTVLSHSYAGLTLGTNYSLAIQTLCSDSSNSGYCTPFPFATTVIPGDEGGGGGGDITD